MKHLANTSILASSLGQTEPLANPLPYCVFLVCLGPPSSLTFVTTIHISHVHPPLTMRRLNPAIQVNNTGVLHLMYTGHMYTVHHIIITIQRLLYTSSTLLGRPAGPDHSCWEHGHSIFSGPKPVSLVVKPQLMRCEWGKVYKTKNERLLRIKWLSKHKLDAYSHI